MADSIGQFFIDLINLIIEGLGVVLSGLIMLFPDTPFGSPASPPSSLKLGYITWLIDFPTMLSHLAGFLVAVISYYAVRVIARWLKMVRG